MRKLSLLILLIALTYSLASAAACAVPIHSLRELREARDAATLHPRRIIMNNDGNDARRPEQEHTIESFLNNRTAPLAGSQVDAIFYCTGVFNVYTHRSKETELRGYGDKPPVDWAWELTKLGTDSLEVITKWSHDHQKECFWSMRMNDAHDSGKDRQLCQWKQAHSNFLMGTRESKFNYGAGRWSAVDYGQKGVRDKVYRILKDVCTRYDIDGIELDFMRSPVFFKPQMTGEPVLQEQCDQMTMLLRSIRAMTEKVGMKRGRPMLISVRIPDSVGFSKAIGLDIEQWLDEGLVDIVVGGCFWHFEPWGNLVALGHKHHVPVYACLSASRIVSAKSPDGTTKVDLQQWNDEAREAWDAGVDGIYTFNIADPTSPLYRQLGSPQTLLKAMSPHSLNPGEPIGMDRWLKDGSKYCLFPAPAQ